MHCLCPGWYKSAQLSWLPLRKRMGAAAPLYLLMTLGSLEAGAEDLRG